MEHHETPVVEEPEPVVEPPAPEPEPKESHLDGSAESAPGSFLWVVDLCGWSTAEGPEAASLFWRVFHQRENHRLEVLEGFGCCFQTGSL